MNVSGRPHTPPNLRGLLYRLLYIPTAGTTRKHRYTARELGAALIAATDEAEEMGGYDQITVS